MPVKTIRRSIGVRCSPVPPARKIARGYGALIEKLSDASHRLAKARRRK